MLLLCLIGSVGVVEAGDNKALDDTTFAVVNGEKISAVTYHSGMRERFYHGNIPDSQLDAFRKEVAQRMVDETLLLQEARRKGIEPDNKAVEMQLAGYEQRYAKSSQWQQRKEKLLPQLRAQLQNKSVISRFTAEIKKVPLPDENAVLKYYLAHPEKFTTPQKNGVSLILLSVDPSSAKSVWDGARIEAEELIKKIKSGESFAELAKIHSADTRSAINGGEMGFLHQGMLAKEAEEALAKLAVGEISEPVTTLQGVVILRLEEVISAKLNPLEKVKERASALLYRELSEQNYTRSLQALQSRASIHFNSAIVEPEK
jgi:parvulin-like peptidyl-prolyl isomerase